MDGILPPQATNFAQMNTQNQQYGFESQLLNALTTAKLPTATSIMAQVMGSDKSGNTVVRFGGNDLILSNALLMAKGTTLSLKINIVSGNISAELLSADGKLPASQPQLLEFGTQKNPESGNPIAKIINIVPQGQTRIYNASENMAAANAKAIMDQVNLSSPASVVKTIFLQPTPEIMQGVRAVLSSAPEKTKQSQNLPQELKAGMQAEAKITSAANSPTTQTPLPQDPEQQQVDTSNRALKQQDFMKDFTPTMKALPNGNLQMNGMVVDSKPNGEVLVETKMGLVMVESENPKLTKGTEIGLELTRFIKTTAAEDERPATLQDIARNWPALKNLAQQHPEVAKKLMGLDNIFAAKLSQFFEAVQKSDVEGWLGKQLMDELDDTAKAQLMNRLTSDFGTLKNLFTDNNNQWQTYLFPVFDGQDVNSAYLHIKNFKDQEDSLSANGVRFMVELETSFYGEMQLDGFIRKTLPAKSFDLIIRTTQAIDDETRQGINQIFENAREITGIKGGLEFATVREFAYSPWKEALNKKMTHDSFIG